MFIIAILNPKGGVGKSTVTCNLSRCLQKRGFRVAIGDSDGKKTKTLFEWSLRGTHEKPEVMEIDEPSAVSDIKKSLGEYLDFVVIDGSASNIGVDSAAVRTADIIIIPVKPSSADAWGCHELVANIKQWQKLSGGSPKAYCLVNQQIKNTNVSKSIETLVQKEYDLPMLTARLSQSVAFMEALSYGSTVVDDQPKSKLSKELNAVTDEILEILSKE